MYSNIGDNGTRKTNLLKAIANLEPVLDDVKNVDSSAEKVEGFYFDLFCPRKQE